MRKVGVPAQHLARVRKRLVVSVERNQVRRDVRETSKGLAAPQHAGQDLLGQPERRQGVPGLELGLGQIEGDHRRGEFVTELHEHGERRSVPCARLLDPAEAGADAGEALQQECGAPAIPARARSGERIVEQDLRLGRVTGRHERVGDDLLCADAVPRVADVVEFIERTASEIERCFELAAV